MIIHITSLQPEPAILSRDTGQRITCRGSCQLTITWMPKMKDVATVRGDGATLLFFMVLDARTFG